MANTSRIYSMRVAKDGESDGTDCGSRCRHTRPAHHCRARSEADCAAQTSAVRQRIRKTDDGAFSGGRAHCDRLEQISQRRPVRVSQAAVKGTVAHRRQGAETGINEEAEHETVRRLFRLSDRAVMALMKPRHDIVLLDVGAPTERTMKQVVASSHSQFPVARSSLDNIVGMVKEKVLLACCGSGTPLNLSDVAHPPLFVPGAIPAFCLLEMFKKFRTHVVLVVNEYGDVEGLITMNDFFDDLVGEVASADKPHERRAAQRPDGSWLIDGKMPGP